MHQNAPQHVFSPIMHQSYTALPAPTLTQDKLNTHLPTRPSFAPVTAFNRAMHKSFRSTVSLNQKRGRWGALHVCIAWKIYDDEQIKRRRQKLTPEFPTADAEQHQESNQVSHQDSHQSSCRRPKPNSARGHSGKTIDHPSCSDRRRLPDLKTSPRHSHTAQREKHGWEKLQHPQSLNWKEKLMEKDRPNDPTNNSHKEKSQAPAVTPEPDVRLVGSQDRKRQLECKHFTKVKRQKQELAHEQLGPPPHAALPALYHKSTQGTITSTPEELVSYPGADMHPYPTASWEPMRNLYSRPDHNLTNYSVTRRYSSYLTKAFSTFYAPSFYCPPPLSLSRPTSEGESFHHISTTADTSSPIMASWYHPPTRGSESLWYVC